MIDLVTAATAAAALHNSASFVDKIYNWWSARHGAKPASEGLRNDPQNKELKFVPIDGGKKPSIVVMTYEDLAKTINKEDFNYIKSFESRMKLAMSQWEALNARLPLASDVERIRIEANMEDMKNRDICSSLKEIVDFIDRIGIDLHDHYRHVRNICPA